MRFLYLRLKRFHGITTRIALSSRHQSRAVHKEVEEVAREETWGDRERYEKAQGAAYNAEHTGAYILALAAIVLGVLGLLTAFQIVELRDYGATASFEAGQAEEGTQGGANVGAAGLDAESTSADSFWDGILLLTTASAAGMLALCLHRNDHHRTRDPRTVSDSDTGFWAGEHAAAYALAVGTIALGAIAILTGFDAFGTDTDQRDGTIWAFAALLGGILTTTLHSVRHHQTVAEQDHLVRVVRERAGSREEVRPGMTTGEVTRDRSR
jgi:hypothetical protein